MLRGSRCAYLATHTSGITVVAFITAHYRPQDEETSHEVSALPAPSPSKRMPQGIN